MASEPEEDGVIDLAPEVIAFTLALLGTPRINQIAAKALAQRGKVTDSDLSVISAEGVYEDYGLNIGKAELGGLDSHIDALARDMSSYALSMSPQVRARQEDRHRWY